MHLSCFNKFQLNWVKSGKNNKKKNKVIIYEWIILIKLFTISYNIGRKDQFVNLLTGRNTFCAFLGFILVIHKINNERKVILGSHYFQTIALGEMRNDCFTTISYIFLPCRCIVAVTWLSFDGIVSYRPAFMHLIIVLLQQYIIDIKPRSYLKFKKEI